jgi:hypothetical protein
MARLLGAYEGYFTPKKAFVRGEISHVLACRVANNQVDDVSSRWPGGLQEQSALVHLDGSGESVSKLHQTCHGRANSAGSGVG